MPLSGVHVLLSYACTHECDHCFLYCSPRAKGTFTLRQIEDLLDQSRLAGTVSSVYFEGGEPFLFFPILLAGLRLAKERGFEVGVVTNCYWATAPGDARVWLDPLVELGVDDLSVSDDALHHGDGATSPARMAAEAARQLGLPPTSICIEAPLADAPRGRPGEPVLGGGVLLKGRAADRLTEGLPTRRRSSFVTCPFEELEKPERVHVDAYGHVHVCQGVVIGNVWKTPLASIMEGYEPSTHPICAPLLRGGPRALAEEQGVALEGEFVDECHYCFALRRALLERFPRELAPPQVYGLESDGRL